MSSALLESIPTHQMETFSDALDLCYTTSGDENAESAEKQEGAAHTIFFFCFFFVCTSRLHRLRFIHPAIFNKPASSPALGVTGRLGVYPSCLWVKAGLHPGQASSSLHGQMAIRTRTHTYDHFTVPNMPD